MLVRKIRILHLIATVDPAYGGPIEGIIQQNSATPALEREIASLDQPEAPFLKNFPIKTYALGSYKTGRGWRNAFKRYGVSSKLIPWLKLHVGEYDCVIVNGLWNFSTFAASQVLPKSGLPYFVFTHGMLDPWFRNNFRAKHALKQCFWLLSEGKLLARANAVLFTTEEERELAGTMFWGHKYCKRVVGYGTSDPPPANVSQERSFRQRVPNLKGRPFVLFLSRIHAKKGCDLLVEAFARVGRRHLNTDLIIAGPDQSGMLQELKKLAADLGISDRVHFPGMLTGEAKWGAFRSAEAFSLPSHSENFGIVVAEALACSTPVLLSNKVNIWREVESTSAGFVEDDTVEGTISTIEKYLNLDFSARQQMRANARLCFERHFDVKRNAKVLEKLICDTVFAKGQS